MKYFFKHFVRGLLFVTPLGVTVLLIISIFSWIEEKVESTHLQGYALWVTMVAIIAALFILGLIGSTLLLKPVQRIFNGVIAKIPLINIIYSSINDLLKAFVGDKKKFNTPVLVCVNDSTQEERIGFITNDNLENLGIVDKVAVYLPHSYAFSGTLSIFPKERIKILNASGADTMKFIVSGGVAAADGKDIKKG